MIRIWDKYIDAEKIIKEKMRIFCLRNRLSILDANYFIPYIKQAEESLWLVLANLNDDWNIPSEVVAYILFEKAKLLGEDDIEIDKIMKEKLGIDYIDLCIASNFWLIEDINKKE